MKRIISLFMAITMILAIVPMNILAVGSAEATTTAVISVQSTNAMSGSDVEVNLVIKNNPGILGMTLKLEYDEAIATLTSVKKGDALSYMTFTSPQDLKSGCQLPWDAENVTANDIKDGVIATLVFHVKDTAQAGDVANIQLSYNNGAIIDNDMNPISVKIENGSIQIIDYIPGDLNGDGLVNTTDVVFLRRYIAGGYGVTINEAAADVNDDGLLNTTDVVFIRRFIAGGYGVELKPSSPKCDHVMDVTAAKAATCTEDGNIAYWHCTNCDKYFSDENGNTVITLDKTLIPATGHTVVIDPAVEPTYTETGLTEGSHCSVCGEVIVPQNTIPALTRDEYSITYHVANNDNYLAQIEIENPNPATYATEEGLELKDLIVAGYTFEGWFDGAGSNAKQVKELFVGTTGNKVLYAKWSRVTYTVQFDCPLDPVDDVTYTVDRGVTLKNPEWFGYTFVGWSDNNGNIVSAIDKGTTGNITLKANWTSKRNQTRPVSKLADPIIYEDEEQAQILFTYEIGTIENVPLYTIKDFGNTSGITVTESITTSNSISKVSAESIANVVSNATTKSSSWTLSKDWNKTTSVSQSHTNEVGSEIIDAVIEASKSEEWRYPISNCSKPGDVSIGDNGISSKLGRNIWDDSSITQESLAFMKAINLDLNLGVASIGFDFGEMIDSIVPEKKPTIPYDIRKINTLGPDAFIGCDKPVTTASDIRVFMNTDDAVNKSNTTSRSHETSKKLSSLISNTYGYGETYSEGGSESTTQAWENSVSESREYATALTYSNGITTTTTKTYSNADAPEGYYRLVCAGKVHVFAVVGYDIATHTYFTYTYNVMDDKTTDFMDYSKNTGSFDDYENGVLPFEIPYEVHECVSEIIGASEGLIVDIDTGKIVGYNGNETDNAVVIPWYTTVDNGDGTNTVVKVTGFESNIFKNNKKLAGIKLGKYVTEIPDSAFEGCNALNNVVYSSIDSIGSNAFAGCTSLTDVTVPDGVTSLGANAFEDVPKVTVNASKANVAENAVYSGAKHLVLNLSPLKDELGGKTLRVSDNTDNFEFNGNSGTYKNLCIVSNADTTKINGATFENTSGIPFTFSSQNVTLNRVNATSQGLTMILSADNTNVGLFGSAKLTSNSGNAVLSKNMSLSWANPGVAGSMNVSGNVLVCGEIGGISNLKVSNGTVRYITQEEFDQWNKYSTVYFDPTGGIVNESARQVNTNSSLGVLPVPTRTGYLFDGWYTSDNVKITSDTVMTSGTDITVYAHWKLLQYTASWASTPIGYKVTVTRISSPYANAPTGTLHCDTYSDAKVYYGDVLSVSYDACEGYHITKHGATSITVKGSITGGLIWASAELSGNHVHTVTGYADNIHYYMEVYTVGNQLRIKGCAYDTTNHNAQIRLDINSLYTTSANLYDTSCSIGGYHGFDFMCGPFSGNVRIMVHAFLPNSTEPISLWDSFEDGGYPQKWVSFPS